MIVCIACGIAIGYVLGYREGRNAAVQFTMLMLNDFGSRMRRIGVPLSLIRETLDQMLASRDS